MPRNHYRRRTRMAHGRQMRPARSRAVAGTWPHQQPRPSVSSRPMRSAHRMQLRPRRAPGEEAATASKSASSSRPHVRPRRGVPPVSAFTAAERALYTGVVCSPAASERCLNQYGDSRPDSAIAKGQTVYCSGSSVECSRSVTPPWFERSFIKFPGKFARSRKSCCSLSPCRRCQHEQFRQRLAPCNTISSK